MLKRILALVIAVIFAMTFFAGCGSSAGKTAEQTSAGQTEETKKAETKSQEKKISGEIQFFTYRDDLLNSWYPKALEEFKAKYPDVTVNTSTSKNFEADLKVKMASNDVPDVISLNSENFSDAQRSQFLLALDDAFPDMVKNWNGNGVNINADDKKSYGLTFGLLGVSLVYNKKMFAEYGLKPPKTFDELIATAKKLKEKGKIGLVGCLKPGWTLTPYVNLAQSLLDNQEDTYKKMAASDAPFTDDSQFVKVMGMVQKMRNEKIWEEDAVSYDWEPYLKDFGSGKSGMAFTWTVTPAQFPGRGDGSVKLEDIGMVPFPYDNSGGPYKAYFAADWSLAIAKNSKNLEAAKAFFKWHMDDKYADYAKFTAVSSSKKGVTVDIPYLKELDDNNPVKVFGMKYPVEFKTIMDKAQLDIFHQYAEVAAGIDVKKEADKMNAAWKKAKASK